MTDCVIWRGGLNSDRRYGFVMLSGRSFYVHRLFYMLYNGPIPRGHIVHHTCEEKLCVNPRHLVTLTRAEHMLVHGTQPRDAGAHQRAKTHCPNGHPYSGDNLRTYAGSNRRCWMCHREDARRRAERRKVAA